MNTAPSNPILRALDTMLGSKPGGWFINIAVIPVLVILALVLPPLSLPSRILSAGFTGVSPSSGGGVSVSDGAQFSIPAGTARRSVSIKLAMTPRDSFLKSATAKSLPSSLTVKSPLYQPSLQGEMPALSILSIPIPDGAEPLSTITVYGLVAKKWIKLPFQIFSDDQRIETYLTNAIPESVIVAQTQAQTPTLSADFSSKISLPPQAGEVLAEVNPIGLTIAQDGGVSGGLPSSAEASASSPYQVLPTVSNFINDQQRSDLVEDMVVSPELRKQHIQTLVDLTVEKLYPGLNVDYQNVNPDYKDDFTKFISELGQALQAKNKLLSVTLAMPTRVTADTWDAGAYDWAAIGQAADIVNIPLPTTRDAYVGDSPMVQSYLQWAVGRVDHFKLQLAVSVLGRDEFGNSFAPLGYGKAIKLLGPIEVTTNVSPGDKVTFDLPKLRDAGGIKFDAVTGLYSFGYRDEKNQTHTVFLENAESLAKKMVLSLQFNLRGMVFRDLGADTLDPRVWDAMKKYRDGQAPAYKGVLAMVWRVNSQSVGKVSTSDPKHIWTAPAQAGDFKVEAVLSFDSGQSSAGSSGVTTLQVAARGPAPRPTAVVSENPEPQPKPTARPQPVAVPGGNFTGKNLFGYGIQVQGGDPAGEAADIKALGFGWVKVQVPWKDHESSKGNINMGGVDGFVSTMNGNGIKVLLSIVKAPDWSRRQYGNPGEGPPDNMQDAADFMGNVAGRYCGKGVEAIEVWNEHNLDVEWHDKRGLNPALYMDMLKRSYASIKAACPGMVVVSGAPTPNGLNNATAIDDVQFLQQLYANGLKQYSDAVGAHPSGFRSPPDIPAGNLGSYADHRSFFFRGTMDAYRQVMVQNGDGGKQIWPTEFGWPVGTGGGAHPAGQYNSPEQVADYFVRAFKWAKAQGWVGAMFVWQLDFSGGEVGAFRVKGSPAFGALQGLAK